MVCSTMEINILWRIMWSLLIMSDVVNLDVWSWFPIPIYITYPTFDFSNILQFKRIRVRSHGSGQFSGLNGHSIKSSLRVLTLPYRQTDIGLSAYSMWKIFYCYTLGVQMRSHGCHGRHWYIKAYINCIYMTLKINIMLISIITIISI